MTKGDVEKGVKCPNCKCTIHDPLSGNTGMGSKRFEMDSVCPHCKVKIHYWARNIIVIEAEVDSKVF